MASGKAAPGPESLLLTALVIYFRPCGIVNHGDTYLSLRRPMSSSRLRSRRPRRAGNISKLSKSRGAGAYRLFSPWGWVSYPDWIFGQSFRDFSRGEIIVDVDHLIPGFLANMRKDIIEIGKMLMTYDYESMERLGHSMKGAGGPWV